jgi:ParB family chromosome partitioning protein
MQEQLDKKGISRRVRIETNQAKTELRVVDVPIELCRPNPNQPRQYFDPVMLKELAASIEQHGLLQPITIKRDPKNKEGFLIVAGERRFRAYESLKRSTIPAIITTGNTDEIALIENLQRQDLSPIEEAEALRRLQKKYGYTHEELGKAVGKARSTITNLLKLNDLPRKIKEESLTSNAASKSLLIELSKINHPKKQLAFWQEAKERGVTIKEARARKRPALDTPQAVQKVLSRGEQFIQELEQLAQAKQKLDKEGYEKLLGVFKRFVSYMEEEANRQSRKK